MKIPKLSWVIAAIQITNQVLELLHRNRTRAFIIAASWHPPHDLWVIPEPYHPMLDRKRLRLHANPSTLRTMHRRLMDILTRDGDDFVKKDPQDPTEVLA